MSQRHLYRSVKDRRIAGVAGGIAEYLEVDSSIVRLIWLLAILFGGAGLLAYLIAWIVIPEKKVSSGDENAAEGGSVNTGPQVELNGQINYVGIFLITLGAFLLLKTVLPIAWTKYYWPLFLIGLGLFLLIPRK